MATYQAIGSVAEGVRRLLEQSWTSTPGGLEPEFAVYHGTDFGTPMKTGISIFVYQVGLDPVQRTLPPSSPDRKRPVPLTIGMLLTAWAMSASTEHDLLGWAIRAVADNPILSAGFLNAAAPDVFRPDETVELVAGQLSNDEVFQLWQAMPVTLQLSMPYQARVLRIESETERPVGVAVLTRELSFSGAPA